MSIARKWRAGAACSVAVAGLALHHALSQRPRLRSVFALQADSVWTPALLFSMLWIVVLFYPRGFQPFIYFQF